MISEGETRFSFEPQHKRIAILGETRWIESKNLGRIDIASRFRGY
jgi:hypothetical protein